MTSLSKLLEDVALTVDDLTLVPSRGVLESRSEAVLKPFIYSAPMDCVTGLQLTKAMIDQGQYAVVSRKLPEREYDQCLREYMNHPQVFFAIGLCKKKLAELFSRIGGMDCPEDLKINLAVDVAHGDMLKVHVFTAWLREQSFVGSIMSGSICTASAADTAIQSGCTHLRVGVGPGAACTTRLITGIGVPNLTAVHKIHKHLLAKTTIKTGPQELSVWSRSMVTIIADGGIKHPGQAVKYLAAGADAVMLGSVFSKTLESAGWTQTIDENHLQELASTGPLKFPLERPKMVLTKTYRGQASAEFQIDHFGQKNRAPEGASSTEFQWDEKTTVKTTVGLFEGGMASAISYLGMREQRDLHNPGIQWQRITAAGYTEGTPHGI